MEQNKSLISWTPNSQNVIQEYVSQIKKYVINIKSNDISYKKSKQCNSLLNIYDDIVIRPSDIIVFCYLYLFTHKEGLKIDNINKHTSIIIKPRVSNHYINI